MSNKVSTDLQNDNPLTNIRHAFTKLQDAYDIAQKDGVNNSEMALALCNDAMQNVVIACDALRERITKERS